MKIVLTGSTGFLGSEVLVQCCEDESIDSIIVLTRRPLPNVQQHAKISNHVVRDFRALSGEVVEAISDADACIWCLGGTTADIEVDYPLAFVQAMKRSWDGRQKIFRYVHCSGVLAERDQTKSLWFLQEGRRAKGRAEIVLIEQAGSAESRGLWHTHIMQPSMIVPRQPGVLQRFLALLLGSIKVDELARAALELAKHSPESHTTFGNNDLALLGRRPQN